MAASCRGSSSGDIVVEIQPPAENIILEYFRSNHSQDLVNVQNLKKRCSQMLSILSDYD